MPQKNAYANIEFKKRGGAYHGSVIMSDIPLLQGDPAETMRVVTAIYQNTIMDVRQWQRDVRELKDKGFSLSARKAWQLGEILYRLNTEFMERGCQVQHLYEHLERHVGLARKRASEFVTFRRYIDNMEIVPEDVMWNSIVKNVKSSSQAIADGCAIEK